MPSRIGRGTVIIASPRLQRVEMGDRRDLLVAATGFGRKIGVEDDKPTNGLIHVSAIIFRPMDYSSIRSE